MRLTLTPMNEADARIIQSWQYEEPYTIYNLSTADLAVLLDQRSPYYTAHDEQDELVGFFCFGTTAQVWQNDEPALYSEGKTLDIGLGMRPDLIGRGLGFTFVTAGLTWASEQFAPRHFRLFVLTFNKRARHVYARAGFVCTREFVQANPVHGALEFIEMQRDASIHPRGIVVIS